MLRKLIIGCILLTIPALANAWILTVRVYGPSSSGTVTVAEQILQVDENGDPVFEKDADGNLLLGEDGKPIPVLIEKSTRVGGISYVQLTGANDALHQNFQPRPLL